jgi:hypothetical protein
VSSWRFQDLEIGDAGVSATVHGGAKESISVTALQPVSKGAGEGWVVRSSNVRVGVSGRCRLEVSKHGVLCT